MCVFPLYQYQLVYFLSFPETDDTITETETDDTVTETETDDTITETETYCMINTYLYSNYDLI